MLNATQMEPICTAWVVKETNSTTRIHFYAVYEGYYFSYFLKISQPSKIILRQINIKYFSNLDEKEPSTSFRHTSTKHV